MPLVRADIATPPPAPPDAASWLDALAHADAHGRLRAALALGDLVPTTGEAAPLLAALAARLLAEPDHGVREAVFSALGQGGPAAAALVAPLVRLEDAGLRNGALETLRRLGDAAVDAVDALLADGDADVRLLAADILRDWPQARALPRLSALLAAESRVNVAGVLVDVAAEVGDASLLVALAECRARFAAEPFIAFSVDAAISRLSGP